ncbi:hypothetical protein BT96DRAFT_1009935 [Gymnopus androsaceus JB14]|uniref:Uncharacterized protein n=1 Tax=Gymnopus androsaceus JB14 TaxID=1447944 RepID=A0A6A4GBM7_9AGAR|nr:hypothetical protein BT96DRAFT_1009935 [Gymnopus androsaceus JB14]
MECCLSIDGDGVLACALKLLVIILAGAFARPLKDNPDKASGYGGAAAFFVFIYTVVFGAISLAIPRVYPLTGNAWMLLDGVSETNGSRCWSLETLVLARSHFHPSTLHIYKAINLLTTGTLLLQY